MSNQEQMAMPSTDILECDDGFHIYMDMPGVAPENLSIDLEQNELAIRARNTYGSDAGRPMRKEFEGHPYERLFTLSDMVDRENIKATVKDGVLDIFLRKVKSVKPRKIEIKAN